MIMTIPVYVPDWQIGDGDIEQPVIGMAFDHVLIFTTDTGDPDMHYDSFGQETTVTGVAEPLAGSGSRVQASFPTAIHCGGVVLYWDAPAVTEGPVTLTGTIDATDYGTVPEGFPASAGVVESMELASVLYVNADGGGINWEPAPGGQQQFLPVSEYPQYVPGIDTAVNPQRQVTGVVLHVATGSAVARGADSAADFNSTRSFDADGAPIRIRIFPDYAHTVLWLFGPVNYTDAVLSPGLSADMAAWEATYCDSLDGNESWKSRSGAAQFTATGKSLAERLAAELGKDFDVEFHSYEPGSRRELFHTGAAAGNPAAAAAFHGIVAVEREERERLAALSAEAGTGWFAYAPQSGTVFDPNNILPPGFTLSPDFNPDFNPDPPQPESGTRR